MPKDTRWRSLYICGLAEVLEFGRTRSARERNDVADVLHTGDEENEAFKTKTETAVGARTETARVEIPPHVFHRYVELFDAGKEFVITLFAL